VDRRTRYFYCKVDSQSADIDVGFRGKVAVSDIPSKYYCDDRVIDSFLYGKDTDKKGRVTVTRFTISTDALMSVSRVTLTIRPEGFRCSPLHNKRLFQNLIGTGGVSSRE